MKVGDLVKEWVGGGRFRTGIVMAIDPLRRGKVGTAGDTCVEVVILLNSHTDCKHMPIRGDGRLSVKVGDLVEIEKWCKNKGRRGIVTEVPEYLSCVKLIYLDTGKGQPR